MKKFLSVSWLLSVLVLLPGCGEQDPDPGPGPEGSGVRTVVLEQAAGSEGTLKVSPAGNWTVVGGEGWFEVTPTNGFAGETELVVTAAEANEGVRERVGRFEIADGSPESAVCYVVQRGVPGMVPPPPEYTVSHAAQELVVEILTSAEYEAESSAGWIEVAGVEYGAGAEILEDGETESSLRKSRLTLRVSENGTDLARTGTVAVRCGEQEAELEVSQLYAVDATDVEWGREFYRRSLFLKFTGSLCGYCPRMIRVYEYAAAEVPGRIEEMNVHGYADDGVMYYEDWGGSCRASTTRAASLRCTSTRWCT